MSWDNGMSGLGYPADSYQMIADAVTGLPLQIDANVQPPETGYDLIGPPGETIHINWDSNPPSNIGEAARNG